MPEFLASRGEFNLVPVTRLDHSELLCNKVLLKYKRDRESEKPVGRGGDEQCPGEGVPTVSLPDFRVAVLAGSARLVASFPLPAVCSWGNRGSSSSS